MGEVFARTLSARRFLMVAFAVLGGLASSLWFFRGFWLSGFTLTQGDDIDGRVIVLQTIHWWQPTAFGNLWDVGIFYPASATLGTSDALLMFGLGSWPFSQVIGTPQVAVQVFLIGLSIISYGFWIFLFRKQLGLHWILSIVASLLLTFGHPIYVISGNFKMLAVWLIPIPLVMFAASLHATRGKRKVLLGLASGLLLGGIALTSVVVLWFGLLASALTLGIWVTLGLIARFNTWAMIWQLVPSFAGGLMGFVIAVPALLLIYAPNLGGTGEASEGTGFALAIRFAELLNVSDTNALWGSILKNFPSELIRSNISDSLPEWQLAPTPLVLLISLWCLVIGIWNARRLSQVQLLGTAALLAGLVFWLLPVRDFIPLPGDGSVFVFPWSIVQYLPGAAGIRYITRFEIFAFMLLVIGIVLVLGPMLKNVDLRSTRGHAQALAALLLITLVLLEQVNTRSMQETTVSWWREMQAISEPPENCKAFALIDELPDRAHHWETMNDARAIAWIHQIPSVNGFSSVSPSGWDLDRVNEDSYMDRLAKWLTDANVSGACLLSLRNGNWTLRES